MKDTKKPFGFVDHRDIHKTSSEFSVTDFETWWSSEAHHYNPMMGEGIFQFAKRMAEMSYGQGVIEGMDRQRMNAYPEFGNKL